MECNHDHHFEHRAAKASHDDICNGAAEHYETLSTQCHSWLSTIPRMIEFYRKYGEEIKMSVENIARSDTMNKKIIELNKRTQRLMYDAQLDGADLGGHHNEAVTDLNQALAYVKRVQELLTESRV